MRMRELFLASMLTVTFGCPAGDDGETDAMTTADTGHETDHETSTTGNGGETTTEGGEESTTGGEGGETTTEGGEESTTAGEGEGSTSGGVSEECMTFCSRYLNTCGDDPGNDYGDQAGCEEACSGFDMPGFECRQMHLQLAMEGDPGTHCPHAGASGGGVC